MGIESDACHMCDQFSEHSMQEITRLQNFI